MATLEDQFELEKSVVQGGIERYHRGLNNLLNKGLEAETSHGRTIIYNMIRPLAEGVIAMMRTEPSKSAVLLKIRDTDPYQLAYLSLVSMINTLSGENRKLIKVAKNIGTTLETQIVIDEWIAQDPEVANEILKMAMKKKDLGYENKRAGVLNKMKKDGVLNAWTDSQRINVGVRFVDLIVQELGFVELERRTLGRNKTPYFVCATEATETWVKKFHQHNETSSPQYKPSLIEPREWTDLFDGGYHSPYIIPKPLVRVR